MRSWIFCLTVFLPGCAIVFPFEGQGDAGVILPDGVSLADASCPAPLFSVDQCGSPGDPDGLEGSIDPQLEVCNERLDGSEFEAGSDGWAFWSGVPLPASCGKLIFDSMPLGSAHQIIKDFAGDIYPPFLVDLRLFIDKPGESWSLSLIVNLAKPGLGLICRILHEPGHGLSLPDVDAPPQPSPPGAFRLQVLVRDADYDCRLVKETSGSAVVTQGPGPLDPGTPTGQPCKQLDLFSDHPVALDHARVYRLH